MVQEDPVDAYIEKAERDASPAQFGPAEHREAIERTVTGSSTSSASSDASARQRDRDPSMSRLPTQRDDVTGLERNETVMSRIQTARSQHSQTVGASIRSRKSTKPLPNFGAGKPFPPTLPNREEYVVEFDGPDDPLHAQNWPMKKK